MLPYDPEQFPVPLVCMSVFAFINHIGVIMGMLDNMRMCRAVMCMRYQMCVSMFMAMYQCISDDQDSPCDHYYQRNYKHHRESFFQEYS